MKITGKAIRNTGLVLLAALGGYAAIRDHVVPPGSSEAQVVQEVARNFFEMREYEAALRSASPTSIALSPHTTREFMDSSELMDKSCSCFSVDMEKELRRRGITDPRQADLFVERVLELNDFKPAADNPDINPAIDRDAYGTIIMTDKEYGRIEVRPGVYGLGKLGERTTVMILTKGKDGKIKYGRSGDNDYHRETSSTLLLGPTEVWQGSLGDNDYHPGTYPRASHDFEILVPGVFYHGTPADTDYRVDMIMGDIGPEFKARELSRPNASLNPSPVRTRTQADNYTGR